MSLRIAGMGWVTPLGRGIDAVWDRLVAGEEASAQSISDGPEGKKYPFFPVPSTALKNLPPHPRLRRLAGYFVAGRSGAVYCVTSPHHDGSGRSAMRFRSGCFAMVMLSAAVPEYVRETGSERRTR